MATLPILSPSISTSGRTLYIKNLNDKIKKQTLKRYLYALCMSYGRVMDIIALKTMKMRGQAFVIFEDPAASALALKSLQGFSFFGKPLRIAYSRSVSKSDPDFCLFQQKEQEACTVKKRTLIAFAYCIGKVNFSDEEELSESARPQSQESGNDTDSNDDKNEH